MYFALNWDAKNGGYVVSVKRMDERGFVRYHDLRKFRDQGDAMIFRDADCPKLSDTTIRALIKRYDPKVQYKRINARKFVDYEKWAQDLYDQEIAAL